MQVSGFHSGCVSFKYCQPLCWGTLRIFWKTLNIGMCDVCFHGIYAILRGYTWWWVGNRGKKIKIQGRRCRGWLVQKTNKGWCGVSQDQKYWTGLKVGGVTYITPEKGVNLKKIYVCACIWRTEINYLENKNGHSWAQLMWTVCNWGGGLGKGCFAVLKRWENC